MASAQAQPIIVQDPTPITPNFVPAHKKATLPAVVPAVYTPPTREAPERIAAASFQPGPNLPIPRAPGAVEEGIEPYVRVDLPGPQRLFMRDSEKQFFDRIANEMKKQPGGARAIFPEEPVISKQPYRPRVMGSHVVFVEPGYVVHGRLFFEQPNFERAGYDFGVLQPAICMGVYYYDLLALPYHACSDLRHPWESSVGKCLPGDPAPLVVTRERFSVTGLIGQTSVIMGGFYLFP